MSLVGQVVFIDLCGAILPTRVLDSVSLVSGMGHKDMSALIRIEWTGSFKISRSLASSVKYRAIHSSFNVRNAVASSPGASERISIALGKSTGAPE